jgi:hypothetical protein
MSDKSTPPSDVHEMQAQKRKAAQAGLDGPVQTRSVKRRASKACQCCRARKVRCNVTEHGAPCTNCRLDEVDCIVSESRRKKSVASFLPIQHFRSHLSAKMSSNMCYVEIVDNIFRFINPFVQPNSPYRVTYDWQEVEQGW